MNHNVIIVSQLLGPFSDIVEELITNGFKVFLITGDNIKYKSKDLVLFKAASLDRKTIFTRFYSWAKFVLYSLIIIWKLDRKYLILVSTTPPLLPWVALMFKLIRDQKYLIRILDIYPETLYANKIISKNNPIYKIWIRLNYCSYKKADKIICIGKIMMDRIRIYLNSENHNKLNVIPDWSDTDYLKPIKKINNPFSKKYSLIEGITVMYSGNIGITHDISILLDLAKELRYDKRFNFVIIGDGIKKEKLRLESINQNLDNIIFFPYQDRDQFNYTMSAADISVVSIQEGSEGLMMPSKTYSGMAVGSVILGISQPPNDMEYIIKKYNCGFNIVPGDINSAKEKLKFFADNYQSLLQFKRNSRRCAVKHFNRIMNTQRIIDVLNKEYG